MGSLIWPKTMPCGDIVYLVQAIFVNLDSNEVLMPSPTTLPPLPDRDVRKLLDHLRSCANIFSPDRVGQGPGDREFDLVFPLMEHLEPITQFASEGGLVLSSDTSESHKKRDKSRFLRSPVKTKSRKHQFDELEVWCEKWRHPNHHHNRCLLCRFVLHSLVCLLVYCVATVHACAHQLVASHPRTSSTWRLSYMTRLNPRK